jgi:hypothetical protein
MGPNRQGGLQRRRLDLQRKTAAVFAVFAGCGWQKSRISAVSAEPLAVFPWKNSDNSDGPDRWREGDWRWSWKGDAHAGRFGTG